MKKTIKRIHVDQQRIRANVKLCSKERLPPISVISSKGTAKGNQVEIMDDNGNVICTVLYRPDSPLGCGARLWIETKQEIVIS